MSSNLSTGYGLAQASTAPFTIGKIFVVTDSAYPNVEEIQELYRPDSTSTAEVRFFSTILSAYNATVSGRNDVILLAASNAVYTLTAMLTVSKDRVHFVGADNIVNRLQDQRVRIQLGVTTAATDVAAIKVTGNGCSFKNIKFINSNTKTESLACFYDNSPNGLVVENCSIHSLGAAQLTATGGCALQAEGDGSTYINCQIGADTILNTVANQVVKLSAVASKAKRTVFQNCYFYTYSSASTHVFFRASAFSIERYVLINGGMMANYTGAGATTLAVAIASAADTDGTIYVSNTNAF